MKEYYRDKVCIVTGGANGIGRCLVEVFANAGCRVAFIDLDQKAGSRLLARLPRPDEHYFCCGDVGSEAVLTEFAGQVIERFGQVHFIMNNACFSNGGILSGCSYEQFNQVLKVGVVAPYYLRYLLREHLAKGASIVNIASTRAFQSQPDTESYSAAKGGIVALTHALAISLSGKARVNSISPGWIETAAFHDERPVPQWEGPDASQHPSGRVGVPYDIAHLALFLCSQQADFITGQNINVDGGMSKLMIYHGDHGWQLTDSMVN